MLCAYIVDKKKIDRIRERRYTIEIRNSFDS